MLKQTILVVTMGFALISCAGDTNADTTTEKATTTEQQAQTTAATTSKAATPTTKPDPAADVKVDHQADELLIQEAGLAGIFTGHPSGDVELRVEKAPLKTAEGAFTVFNFRDKNKTVLGYYMLDPEDPTLIGDITITSPSAATKDGISIGATYAELKAVAPDVVVHGSEIESRTTAYVGRIAYVLDFASNSYEVDESKIKPNTRIKEIRILRHPQKAY